MLRIFPAPDTSDTFLKMYRGLPWWFSGKESTCQCRGHRFNPWSEIRSDQSLSCVRLFSTPWIAAHQASLSITNSRSSLRLTSIESVMPSSHLILCHPLLLFSSSSLSSLSSIRVVSSAYLRLLIFLPAILIPACVSSSPAFLMMYSAYKLNKQGDNI